MTKRIPVIASYTALILLSLPAALLHESLITRAMAWMSPAFAVPANPPAGIPVLFLHWLGTLSWLVTGILLVLLAASFRRETLAKYSTICTVALCQSAFLTLYALSTTLLLGFEWLALTNHLRW